MLLAAMVLAANLDLRAQVEKTMRSFEAMNAEAFRNNLDDGVTAFELDLEGKPVRLGSREEAVHYANEIFSALHGMNATLKLDIHNLECHEASNIGYCTVEFDADVTMPDKSVMTQPTRNTIVLRKEKGAWKWVHWHSSLSTPQQNVAPGGSR